MIAIFIISLFSIDAFSDTTITLNAGLNIRKCAGICHFPTKSNSIQIVLKKSSENNSYAGDYVFEVPEIDGLYFVASLFVVKSYINKEVSCRVEGRLTTFKSTNTDYTFLVFWKYCHRGLSKVNLNSYTDIPDADKNYAVVLAIRPSAE